MRCLSVSIAIVVILLFPLPPAATASKLSECRQIGQVDRKLQDEAGELVKQPFPEEKKAAEQAMVSLLQQVAEMMERSAKQMQSLRLQDRKLRGFRQRYVRLYKDTAGNNRARSAALQRQDQWQLNRVDERSKQLSKERENLFKELERYCIQQK